MKLALILSLVTLAVCWGQEYEPLSLRYHQTIGIKEAARVKAVKEASALGARIVGGSDTFLGSYPHMGGLVIYLSTGDLSICGSSLISNTRLVTAAHCWWDGETQALLLEVVLGSVTLFQGGTRVTTSEVQLHPDYNTDNLHNDVGVISIESVEFTNTISPVNLASTEVFGEENFAGLWCWAAGYGRTSDDDSLSTSQTLRSVSLQGITNGLCRYHFGDVVINSTLCTSGVLGRSMCGGDSGGPLTRVAFRESWLVGISSFFSGRSCQGGAPSGFARVTHYEPWIRSMM